MSVIALIRSLWSSDVLSLQNCEVKRYRYLVNGIVTFSAMFLCYIAVYWVRKDYNVAVPYLKDACRFSNGEIGLIAAAFSVPYGLGKFLFGMIADQVNAKRFAAIMLMLAGIFSVCFAYSIGIFWLMIFFWGINGACQSGTGPASLTTLNRWVPKKSRGSIFGLFNVSINIGGATAAFIALSGLGCFSGHVKGMFILPGILAMVFAFYTFFVGHSSPEDANLGSVESNFGEHDEKVLTERTDKLPMSVLVKKYVFGSKFVIFICLVNVFVYIIRIGVDQWVMVFLPSKGFSIQNSALGYALFEFAAIPATFLWGFFSDLLKGRRCLVCIMCLVPLFLVIIIYSNTLSLLVVYACLALMGMFIYGPQCLIGVILTGLVPKKAFATADGLAGVFGYIVGDMIAKIGLGFMSDHYGWKPVFVSMLISIVLGVLFLYFVAKEENRKIVQASMFIR